MITAKYLQNLWEHIPEKAKKEQINHLLKNCKENINHTVNKLTVFEISESHFEVINTESFKVKFFDTKEEALNYCLDFYPESFKNEQIKLL